MSNSTVRFPHRFTEVVQYAPTVLELSNDQVVKYDGNWIPQPGSSLARFGGGQTDADGLRRAVERLRTTWIGDHGDVREWLAENPVLTVELLNRCGYRYVPQWMEVAEPWVMGHMSRVTMVWQNRGVARADRDDELHRRLSGGMTFETAVRSGNTR